MTTLQSSMLFSFLGSEGQGVLKSVLELLMNIKRGQKPQVSVKKCHATIQSAMLKCSYFCFETCPKTNEKVYGQPAMNLKVQAMEKLISDDPEAITYKDLEPFKQFEWLTPESMRTKINEQLDKLNAGAGLIVLRQETEGGRQLGAKQLPQPPRRGNRR